MDDPGRKGLSDARSQAGRPCVTIQRLERKDGNGRQGGNGGSCGRTRPAIGDLPDLLREPVADSRKRQDVAGSCRPFPECFPQQEYVLGQIRFRDDRLPQNCLQQFVLGHRKTAVPYKHQQQIERLRRKRDSLSRPKKKGFEGIEAEFAELVKAARQVGTGLEKS